MAEQYELNVGGNTVKVPAWATEETIKAIATYSKGTAAAVTEMLRANTRNNQVVKDNKALFKSIAASTKENANQTVENNKSNKAATNATVNAITKSGNKLASQTSSMMDAMEKGSYKGMAAAMSGSGILGTVFGAGAAVLESFTGTIINLSNQGVGLTSSLIDLRARAADSGMNLQQYSEFVVSNGAALAALGNTANDGMNELAGMSRKIRENAREFNTFGMTVSEINEVMVDEINIRRQSGMNQLQIQNSVTKSMNDLLLQTTGLANLAGVDRRELLRARQSVMNDSTISIESMTDTMRNNMQNFSALFELRGGDAGADLATAIIKSQQTGLAFQSLSDSAAGMSVQARGAIQGIADFYNQNVETMDSGEFGSRILEQMGSLSTMFSDTDIQQLQRNATQGVAGARELAELIAGFRQIGGTFAENKAAMEQTERDLRDSQNSLLQTPELLTTWANDLRAGALTDIMTLFNVDIRNAGGALVSSLEETANNFKPDTGGNYSATAAIMQSIEEILGPNSTFILGMGTFGLGIAGVNGVFKTIGLVSSAGTASTLVSGIGALSKAILPLGLAISALNGILDPAYEDYGTIDRAAIGVAENTINLADGSINAFSWLGGTVGLGDGTNNVDLSNDFKDAMSNNEFVKYLMTFGRAGDLDFYGKNADAALGTAGNIAGGAQASAQQFSNMLSQLPGSNFTARDLKDKFSEGSIFQPDAPMLKNWFGMSIGRGQAMQNLLNQADNMSEEDLIANLGQDYQKVLASMIQTLGTASAPLASATTTALPALINTTPPGFNANTSGMARLADENPQMGYRELMRQKARESRDDQLLRESKETNRILGALARLIGEAQ